MSSPVEKQKPQRQQEIAALQAQAWEAFSGEFAALLRNHPGQWVAYHGASRECIGASQSAVYQECKQRGLAAEELFVELIHSAALDEPTVCLSPSLEVTEAEA
jgi:hypothetical protein